MKLIIYIIVLPYLLISTYIFNATKENKIAINSKNIKNIENISKITKLNTNKKNIILKIHKTKYKDNISNNSINCIKFLYLNNKIEKKLYNLEKKFEKFFKKIDTPHLLKQEKQNTKNKQITNNIFITSQLIQQINNNKILFKKINKQCKKINIIILQQKKIYSQTSQIQHILEILKEQTKWIHDSTELNESIYLKISKKLLEILNTHKNNNDIEIEKTKRLHYKNLINKNKKNLQKNTKINNTKKNIKNYFLETQYKIQNKILNLLIHGCEIQILELTKLNFINKQFKEKIKEIQEEYHKHLFWIADITPISTSFLYNIIKDIKKIFTQNIIHQLSHACKTILTKQELFIPLFFVLFFVILSINSKHHYCKFLEKSSIKVGKVNQDKFSLTSKNIFFSILISLPIPILWTTIGYVLQNTFPYSIAIPIGSGIITSSPTLLVYIIYIHFSHPKGLFLIHFNWPYNKIKKTLYYCNIFINIIIILIISLITFNNYNNNEFSDTLGRLSFILLCTCLTIIKIKFKNIGLPIHLGKNSNHKNIINRLLWNLIIYSPIILSIASCFGHLSTTQILLVRLETSILIWFMLLIVYYTIRRWMFIQRRRIAFEQAKQRRAKILAQREKNKKILSKSQLNKAADEVDKKILDLDTISFKSLELIRSILTLISLVLIILLWSELHFTFTFLERITLWEVTTNTQGTQYITLNTVLIFSLIFIITSQMVRNLPALLELTLLQHLNLSPGTGYAITTLTKYSLMLLGGVIGFSIIGIEWSTLQWLIAALGVGLGFGLQEIFANFISGLMILFEKPIRIGDTVTIRKLTGNITKINIRATTITDWDKKEIIVPNKAFITEQFINWSLSDSITRIVLNIPAPQHSNIKQITKIILKSANSCNLIIRPPKPEVFLVDLQRGIQFFELRIYTSKMQNRIQIRHQINSKIIEYYKQFGIKIPHQQQYFTENLSTDKSPGTIISK
ncbi:MAG: miniconductance mechanosensitive channel MscM [Candidatus Westeberhardia cardiocondylae]|nr:miniconductance mechanosensitive channel MscM [Candidatus Westeberhardia cardiocondylae]